jgi:hypothetical protein
MTRSPSACVSPSAADTVAPSPSTNEGAASFPQCETCDAPATQKVFDDIWACDECAGWHLDAGR